ncbi:glycoside-pentoside-hexuronide (GPH):cation symporter [Paenibacillus doosanensis]|uniref:Symporter YjmB n=1 Tax=Paenibacillus konkukensis TaxID=2020716 RepID=A0ABY4RDM0_9BACL|nr:MULTISPECIES: glycoside-pentoside-hexuronide (GPH):cation symporter [Paenibacillus]MCS7462317.1 glycoside-pentoside-hexuronide (GPH):cation symporter [Paenibacillus doosanensis]UQZ80871.1 putative symporter YjmB [Paenibacillus konkukensis]
MKTQMESNRPQAISRQRRPFGMRDKIGYMFGDMGNDMFFAFIGGYLMLFYTDVAGIAGATAGIILLVARVLDALFDVGWGAFVDSRKPGPRGKFRPYLLYSALPVTALGVLTFIALPHLSAGWRLAYAAVTYIVWGFAYSTINIPYGSLASVITSDPVERTSLSTFRMLGACIANLIILAAAPAILFSHGKTPTAGGFVTAAVLFAVMAIVFYFSAYALTTERVQPRKTTSHEQASLRSIVKSFMRNRSLLGLMLASFGLLVSSMLTSALLPYLFKDYFHKPGLISLAGFMTMGAMLVVMPVLSPLVKRFGKKESSIGGLSIAVIVNAFLFMLPISNPYVYIALSFVSGMGMAFMNVIVWAMVSDCIDYHEYLTGKREEGTVYAVYSLMRKIGQAAAGGLGGGCLALIGYVSGADAQSAEVARGIKSAITLVPALGSLLSLAAMLFIYHLTKSRVAELNKQLTKQREALR